MTSATVNLEYLQCIGVPPDICDDKLDRLYSLISLCSIELLAISTVDFNSPILAVSTQVQL